MQVFISHSSQDAAVAQYLIDLLRAALNLRPPDIRCTSVDGYRLSAGADTGSHLRREILEACSFIGIVSESSMNSAWVLFELGARWGVSKPLIPLLAPGAPVSLLKGPLASLNALSCNVGQLLQLVSDVGEQLEIQPNTPESYLAKVEQLSRLCEVKDSSPFSDKSQKTQTASRKPQPNTHPSAAPESRVEQEIVRLERLLKSLPAFHISTLRALSKGPQSISYKSEVKESLMSLGLIKYVGSVTPDMGLFEATSEQALGEYFRRKRAIALPSLLKGLSPAERHFISLFQLEDPFKELSDLKTGLLPSSTYSARHTLEQKELISLRAKGITKEVFVLAPDAASLLADYLGSAARRTEIEIDLNKVAAPQSRGGGAQGTPSRR